MGKPKEWEYYKNPISRLMVKYLKPFGVQQEYEMNMHGVWEAVKIAEMRSLKKKFTDKCRFMVITRVGTTGKTSPNTQGFRGRAISSTPRPGELSSLGTIALLSRGRKSWTS